MRWCYLNHVVILADVDERVFYVMRSESSIFIGKSLMQWTFWEMNLLMARLIPATRFDRHDVYGFSTVYLKFSNSVAPAKS